MPRGRLETLEDCEDFINGCLFMGTGGGGSAEWGMSMFRTALDRGLPLEWVDASDVDDEALTATTYGMGSIAPADPGVTAEIESLGLREEFGHHSMAESVRGLSTYLGRPVDCLVAAELGAGNSPAPLVTAAELGVSLVDGDYAGRAIPDEMQGTPYLYGKDGWPFCSVDAWGNVAIVPKAVNGHMMERLGKMLAVAAYGHTSISSSVLSGAEMKKIIVPGTLTKCLNIGRAIRRARLEGGDPIEAALEVTRGWRLFDAVVVAKEWEDRGGYMYGTLHLDGVGADAGHRYRVWFKNENHITWRDDEPWIFSPDLVTLVDSEAGIGHTNTAIAEGDKVTAVGMTGLTAQRDPHILDTATGPRYYGFPDIAYRPIEDVLEPAGRR